MRNEIKVGIALVVAALLFFFGVRYFAGMPLLGGARTYYTLFDDTDGLIDGATVRVNGVQVGSVESVELDLDRNKVRVEFKVNEDVPVTQAARTETVGVAFLGTVNMRLYPRDITAPPVERGGFVPPLPPGESDDPIARLTGQAPQLAARADSILLAATQAAEAASSILAQNEDRINRTLRTLDETTTLLSRIVLAERGRIDRTLGNLEATSAGFRRLTEENADSISIAVANLNQALRSLDNTLASLDNTAGRVDTLLAEVREGDGTLSLLLRDSSLYYQLDSTAADLEELLEDVRQNPGRYLRELELIDIL